jgi:hypothetical protein
MEEMGAEEQAILLVALELQVEQTLVAVRGLDLVVEHLEQVLLVVLGLSLSLTQAHNNLVVAQSHQVVARLFTHLLLVVC